MCTVTANYNHQYLIAFHIRLLKCLYEFKLISLFFELFLNILQTLEQINTSSTNFNSIKLVEY